MYWPHEWNTSRRENTKNQFGEYNYDINEVYLEVTIFSRFVSVQEIMNIYIINFVLLQNGHNEKWKVVWD